MAVMKPVVHVSRILRKLDMKFRATKKNSFLSATSLIGFPSQTDSPRMIMDYHAKSQMVTMIDSQKPFVNTNFEDLLGDNSGFRKTVVGNHRIVAKVKKFDKLDTPVQPYVLFVQNIDTGVYDVWFRNDVENLSEKYGFQYVNDVIDSLEEGDVVEDGTVLYHPTSYDEYDNYGYGQNTLFMYLSSPDTMEDSISITESFAKKFSNYEVEPVKVSINDNNALINIYGDNEHYQAFPNVGEMTKKRTVCVRRTINRNQLYFDFKSSNMRKVLGGDRTFTSEGMVVDIEIYCNKKREEIPNTKYNQQLLEYIDMLERYRSKVFNIANKLMREGKTTLALRDLRHRMETLIDENYVLKDESNRPFSNMKVEFLIKRQVGVFRGQKITGRHGNKGVISRIIPDSEAYHLRTGEIIPVVLNPLGVPNRLNIFQLFEQAITFRARRVTERIRETPNLKDKAKLLFSFIRVFNEKEADAVEKTYKELPSTAERKKFMDDVETKGIFITIDPFWRDVPLYDRVVKCDEMFPWIEHYDLWFYNKQSKRWVQMMTKQPIGYMYLIKMKQSSIRGMSARGTGPINMRGVPDKSSDAKKHIAPYANGAVRLGVQELSNYTISAPPELIAGLSLMYRSSPVARRELGKLQERSPLGLVEHFTIKESMSNRNVETLNCKLLAMGLELADEEDVLDLSDTPGIKSHIYKNQRYFCTTNEMRRIVARDIVENEVNGGGRMTVIASDATKEEFIDHMTYVISMDVEDFLEM